MNSQRGYTREKINKHEFHELARDYFREPSHFHNADLRCHFASPRTAKGRTRSFSGLSLRGYRQYMEVNGYKIGPGANLSGANLSGADLSGADLSGANLAGANLAGANLTWLGALYETANLSGANLTGANLTGANLRHANLSDANLSDANLSDADLRHADLVGANLRHANLTGANLNFYPKGLIPARGYRGWRYGAPLLAADLTGANFTNAGLARANLPGADLRDLRLTGTTLAGAELSDANLTGADLSGADLSGADMWGANLRGANLERANLTETRLGVRHNNARCVDLTGANLRGANLERANLTGSNLTGSDLTGANLKKAHLVCANLTLADLTLADLTDAALWGADRTDAILTGAVYTYDSFLDKGRWEGRTEELFAALGRRHQPVPSVKMQLLSIIGSSHHANLVMAILVATFGWINLPPDLRIWGVVVGVIVLLTLSFARISSSEHLEQRDGNLSGNEPGGPRTGVESLGIQPEAPKEKRQKTAGRRWTNSLLLAALVANLAWAFAANPKPEEPGIVASVVLGTWTLVRLTILARTRGFRRRGQRAG